MNGHLNLSEILLGGELRMFQDFVKKSCKILDFEKNAILLKIYFTNMNNCDPFQNLTWPEIVLSFKPLII